MRKVLATAVSFIFVCTNILFAHKPIVANDPVASPIPFLQGASLSPRLLKQVGSLANDLPASLLTHVQIKKVIPAEGKSAVLLVEDLHQNLEAQTHISHLISSFGTVVGNGKTLVALEGAAGDFIYDRFRTLPEPQKIQSIVDQYLETTQISGPAHSGFSFRPTPGHKDILFQGIEDRSLYRRNVAAYRAGRDVQAITQSKIEKLVLTANQQKKIFNPALAAFDATVVAYRAEKISFGEYVEAVANTGVSTSFTVETFLQAFAMEKSLDFARVEIERARILGKLVKSLSQKDVDHLVADSLGYQQGSVAYADYYQSLRSLCQKAGVDLRQAPAFDNYIRYVLLSDSVQASPLFHDLEKMEEAALAQLTQTEHEEQTLALSRQLYLADQLTKFSLTSDEWALYQEGRSHLSKEIDLTAFEEFYLVADRRSYAMVENLQGVLRTKNTSGDTSLVIAGGFHTAELTKLFKERGFTVIVASPKVTKIESASATQYLSVFDRERTPLEKLFSGKKLFLSAPVAGQVTALDPTMNLDPTPEIVKALGTQRKAFTALEFPLALSTLGAVFTWMNSMESIPYLWGALALSWLIYFLVKFRVPQRLAQIWERITRPRQTVESLIENLTALEEEPQPNMEVEVHPGSALEEQFQIAIASKEKEKPRETEKFELIEDEVFQLGLSRARIREHHKSAAAVAISRLADALLDEEVWPLHMRGEDPGTVKKSKTYYLVKQDGEKIEVALDVQSSDGSKLKISVSFSDKNIGTIFIEPSDHVEYLKMTVEMNSSSEEWRWPLIGSILGEMKTLGDINLSGSRNEADFEQDLLGLQRVGRLDPSDSFKIVTKNIPEEDLKSKIHFENGVWHGGAALTMGNVARLAQAMAESMKTFPGKRPTSVIVGYDTRPGAKDMAVHIARVLRANGIRANIANAPTPTAMLVDLTGNKGRYGFAIHVTGDNSIVLIHRGALATGEETAKIEVFANDPTNRRFNWIATKFVQTDVVEKYIGKLKDYFDFPSLITEIEAYRGANPDFGLVLSSQRGVTSRAAAQLFWPLNVVDKHLHTSMKPSFQSGTLETEEFHNTIKPGQLGILFSKDGESFSVVDVDGKTVITPGQLAFLFADYLKGKGYMVGSILQSAASTQELDKFAFKNKLRIFQKHPENDSVFVGLEGDKISFRYKDHFYRHSALAGAMLTLEILVNSPDGLSAALNRAALNLGRDTNYDDTDEGRGFFSPRPGFVTRETLVLIGFLTAIFITAIVVAYTLARMAPASPSPLVGALVLSGTLLGMATLHGEPSPLQLQNTVLSQQIQNTLGHGDKKTFRILHLDDEEYMRTDVRLFLENLGFEVVSADDGTTGLERLNRNHPQYQEIDFIISDGFMDEMNGAPFYRTVTTLYPQLTSRFLFLSRAEPWGFALEGIPQTVPVVNKSVWVANLISTMQGLLLASSETTEGDTSINRQSGFATFPVLVAIGGLTIAGIIFATHPISSETCLAFSSTLFGTFGFFGMIQPQGKSLRKQAEELFDKRNKDPNTVAKELKKLGAIGRDFLMMGMLDSQTSSMAKRFFTISHGELVQKLARENNLKNGIGRRGEIKNGVAAIVAVLAIIAIAGVTQKNIGLSLGSGIVFGLFTLVGMTGSNTMFEQWLAMRNRQSVQALYDNRNSDPKQAVRVLKLYGELGKEFLLRGRRDKNSTSETRKLFTTGFQQLVKKLKKAEMKTKQAKKRQGIINNGGVVIIGALAVVGLAALTQQPLWLGAIPLSWVLGRFIMGAVRIGKKSATWGKEHFSSPDILLFPTPPEVRDPIVQKIMKAVPVERIFGDSRTQRFDAENDALDAFLPQPEEGTPAIIHYMVTSSGFEKSLSGLEEILNRKYKSQPELVLSSVKLTDAQLSTIQKIIPNTMLARIVDVPDDTVSVDHVMEAAATQTGNRPLPRVQALVRDTKSKTASNIRLLTITNGVPFTASEAYQEFMRVVLMNIDDAWVVVPVETAIKAFQAAAIKA